MSLWFAANCTALGPGSAPSNSHKVGLAPTPAKAGLAQTRCRGAWRALSLGGKGVGVGAAGWGGTRLSTAGRRLQHPACVLIPRGPRDAAASQPTHPPLMRRVWASSELGSHSTNPRIFLTPEGPYLSPATPSSRALPQPATLARVRCAWTGCPRRGGRSRQSSRVHPTRRLQGSSLRGPVSHACPDEAVAPAVWWGCTVARSRRGDLGLRRLVAHCT